MLVAPSRSEWLSMLGEMVQMVNEAVRRRAATAKDASKPLSLEYMADRLDVVRVSVSIQGPLGETSHARSTCEPVMTSELH